MHASRDNSVAWLDPIEDSGSFRVWWWHAEEGRRALSSAKKEDQAWVVAFGIGEQCPL